MKALVLAGGGAKGAYEMGVWKALRRLKIKIDIVTGTSIGSLNGALIVQNSYYKAMRLWLTTDFYKLFGSELKNLTDVKKALQIYSENILKRDGIDTYGYQDLVKKTIDLNKFYNSPINYGLITYNFSTRKPCLLTKNKIKRDKLCDYIIASTSCFPALDMKEIDGDKYVDGGYYDNMPINLAVDMGATNVIAVDLESVGIVRNVKDDNVEITYIKPSCDLGNFLVFDQKLIKKNIAIGYNDTMKKFGKLDGDYYTFKKNHLNKNYQKYGEEFAYIAKRMIGINTKKTLNKLTSISFYRHLIKNNFNDRKTMNKSLELLGEIFEVPNQKIYDINMFNHILKTDFANFGNEELIDIENLKNLHFNQTINRRHIVKHIYNYMLKPVEYHKQLLELSILFPKEFMGALYLYTIS